MAESHLPYRLTETNSCYHGGKPGLSNTFASSLWALDLMFQVALLGGEGINFHGGGYGWYSPIVGTVEDGFVARPEYYALLLFSQLLGARIVSNHLEVLEVSSGARQDLLCHSLQNTDGRMQAVVINKSATLGFDLTVQAGVAARRISIQRLIAPGLESQSDVTFSGAPVGMRGAWRADHVESASLRNGAATSFIPAASAALLTWEG
ncbi:MAG: glycosyl hydrolase family 79 C-terminal domain-containing protein [Terracidiphilus sp.]